MLKFNVKFKKNITRNYHVMPVYLLITGII